MRGLLAIEPLYHAIVAGKKTQTRRAGGLDEVNHKPDYWHIIEQTEVSTKFLFNQHKQRSPEYRMEVVCKPRYKVGEVLYLKEPYTKELIYNDPDNDDRRYRYSYEFDKQPHIRKLVKWKNKLFMPAEAARAFVRITGIKCERLLDISDEDCIAEGIERDGLDNKNWKAYGAYTGPVKFVKGSDGKITAKASKNGNFNIINIGKHTPKESFLSLYKFANKMKASAEVPNLWVWVYSFEYLKDFQP